MSDMLREAYAEAMLQARREGFEGDFNALCREVLKDLGEPPTPTMWVSSALAVVDCLGGTQRGVQAPLKERVVAFMRDRDVFTQQMLDEDLAWHLEEGVGREGYASASNFE